MIRSIILTILGGALLLMALRSLRAQRLKEGYVLLFIAVGLPFLVLAVWPDAVVFLSDALAIEKATVLIMCLTVFVVLMLFKLLSILSVQEQRIATLTQLVGILMQHENLSRPQSRAHAIEPRTTGDAARAEHSQSESR